MSRYFTKFAVAVLLVMGMVGASRAQDAAAEKDIIRPITKSGSAAFLFTLNGLGDFGIGAPAIASGVPGTGTTAGAGLLYGAGMKYYFSDNLALRLLLAFNNFSNKDNSGGTSTVTNSQTDFGIGAGVEYHFRPLYSTSPYIGGVVSFGSTTVDNGLSGAAQVKDAYNKFGINVIAGFDWFWTHGLALGAEYGLGFASQGGTQTVGGSTNTDLPSTTIIGINGGGNVHLVVYF